MLKKFIPIALLLLVSGCARHYVGISADDTYGFFSGIWHGLIAPLTIVVNIFSWLLSLFGVNFLQDVQIIGRPNTGFFYWVGFIMGFATHAGQAA
jgi:hypothetical protein